MYTPRLSLLSSFGFGSILCLLHLSPLAQAEESDPILLAMSSELDRTFTQLQTKDVPPYWIELAITDSFQEEITFIEGALDDREHDHERIVDVDLRVGDWTLDNTHPIIDGSYFSDGRTHFTGNLPLEGDSLLLRREIWKVMDQAYRSGLRRLIKIESNQSLKVDMEDQSDDFSPAPALEHLEPLQTWAPIEQNVWDNRLRDCSKQFLEEPNILYSYAKLAQSLETRWIVTTDGIRVREVRPHARLMVMASARAEDGMELNTFEYIDATSTEEWNENTCFDLAKRASKNLMELLNAPIVDPYVGPAILRGQAAAVFFHEILGHRVEGSRQKDDDDGQTLSDKVGEAIFPSFINVEDDPTRAEFNGLDLNGHYRIDDDGVAASAVSIVENGILQGFLMSRTPIENFPSSNGHGRRQTGRASVARQGNLIVTSNETVSYNELKAKLLAEVKAQGKPFGLIFDDISGGFTFTGRNTPNSYVVKPVTVWRIYPDGREEMVRGVDMIGTPLLTFSRIVAASDEMQVFNGSCGAESGWVPVTGIAPDLLVSEVEIQRRSKGHDKPPILPAPTLETTSEESHRQNTTHENTAGGAQ